MANITKIERAKGTTYRIRVGNGYASDGIQRVKSMNWTPETSMTEKQIQKELMKVALEFEKKVQEGIAYDKVKFEEFSKIWLKDYAEKKCSPMYVSVSIKLLEEINKGIGHIPLPKLRKFHLQELYRKLADDVRVVEVRTKDSNGNKIVKRVEKRRSPATILRYHRVISAILTKAVQWDYIGNNICLGKGVELPKQSKYRPHYLQDCEVLKLVELLQNEPIEYRTLIMLLLYTGMRNGEAMGLEWRDIDFQNNIISINRCSQYIGKVGIFTKDTKNSSSERAIQVVPEVMDMLRQYKLWQTEQRLSKGIAWKANPENTSEKHCDNWRTCSSNGRRCYCSKLCPEYKDIDRLFIQYNGIPMHPDTPLRWLKGFIKRHGLPDFNIHSLRHTNISLMIMQGVPLPTVARLVGHSSTATTSRIYSHSIQTAEQMAVEKVANIINPERKIHA